MHWHFRARKIIYKTNIKLCHGVYNGVPSSTHRKIPANISLLFEGLKTFTNAALKLQLIQYLLVSSGFSALRIVYFRS